MNLFMNATTRRLTMKHNLKYYIIDNSKTLLGPTYHHFLRECFKINSKWNTDNTWSDLFDYSNVEGKSKIKNLITELYFLDSKKKMHDFMKNNELDFYPNSFLDTELDLLSDKKEKSYLIKPAGFTIGVNKRSKKNAECHSGNGIKVFGNVKDIKSYINSNKNRGKYIIQENLTNLDLIDGLKYDVRCYLLATCSKNKLSYYYHTGHCRLTNKKYDKNSLDLTNILTNLHYQEKQQGYNSNKQIRILSDLDGDNLRQNMIIKSLNELCKFLPKESSIEKGFFLFGVDFMFSEDLKPYLIEFNHNPLFGGCDNKKYLDLQTNLIEELVDKIIEPILFDEEIVGLNSFIRVSDI